MFKFATLLARVQVVRRIFAMHDKLFPKSNKFSPIPTIISFEFPEVIFGAALRLS